MFKQSTSQLRSRINLAIIITGATLFCPISTHAEMCDCWCLVSTGAGDSNCFPAAKQQQENCDSACYEKYKPDFYKGTEASWCGANAKANCQAVASPGFKKNTKTIKR